MPWRTAHGAQVVSKKLCDVSMGCSHPIPLCGEGWEFLSRNHLIPSQIAQAGGAHFSVGWGRGVSSSGWRIAQWSLSLGILGKAARSEGSQGALGAAHWLQHPLAEVENKPAPHFPAGDQGQETFEGFKSKLDWAQSSLDWWKMLFHGREIGIWRFLRLFLTWAILWPFPPTHLVHSSTLICDVPKLSFSPKFQNPWDLHVQTQSSLSAGLRLFKNLTARSPSPNLKIFISSVPCRPGLSIPNIDQEHDGDTSLPVPPCTHWHAGFPLLLLTQAFTIPLALLALSS